MNNNAATMCDPCRVEARTVLFFEPLAEYVLLLHDPFR